MLYTIYICPYISASIYTLCAHTAICHLHSALCTLDIGHRHTHTSSGWCVTLCVFLCVSPVLTYISREQYVQHCHNIQHIYSTQHTSYRIEKQIDGGVVGGGILQLVQIVACVCAIGAHIFIYIRLSVARRRLL